ncbi:MAG: SulP family inorganic anion transporter [Desulfobacterales bacterium]|nr:SulP family inorganic anion transporter [Desulfobacterales bacterium]
MHFRPENIVPFVAWLRHYRIGHLRADFFAGMTVAVVALPQSMAYALIAGLPVQYGLYASIVPAVVGSLWGSSAHLITGPTTAVSLVVFSTLSDLAAPGSSAYLELAFFLALMIGFVQIVMGLARLGNLLNFVSHAVLLGFTAGAAVLIAFKQLPGLLGIPLEKGQPFLVGLFKLLLNVHQTHPATVLLGAVTIATILVFKRLRPRWPGTLLAMILVGLLVHLFDLDRQGVAVVGAIPASLPPFHPPAADSAAHLGRLAPGALAIAILGLVEAVSIAKSIADQTRQRLNVNREFVAQGMANVGAALFSGYPGSGSFTRSAVNFRAGGRTPMSAVVSALAIALVVLTAGPLAAKLPLAALAGVLIVVAYELIRVRDIVRTIRATRSDAAVLAITFLATVLLNIEFAIYIGILLSIGLHLARTSHPRIDSVTPDRPTGKLVPAVPGAICCQMDIVQIDGSIFFGSAAFVIDDLQRRLRQHPDVANLLIRMHHVNTIDASGIHVLEILLEEIQRRGGGLFFAGVHHQVFLALKNSGLLKDAGDTHVHASTGRAIRHAMRENFCADICAACPVFVFEECQALKSADWSIFGPGVQPRFCRLPDAGANAAETQSQETP